MSEKSKNKIKLIDFRDYKFRCHYLGNLIGTYLDKCRQYLDNLTKQFINHKPFYD